MAGEWWVKTADGTRRGPLTRDEVQEELAAGAIGIESQLRQGDGEWLPAKTYLKQPAAKPAIKQAAKQDVKPDALVAGDDWWQQLAGLWFEIVAILLTLVGLFELMTAARLAEEGLTEQGVRASLIPAIISFVGGQLMMVLMRLDRRIRNQGR